jgi:hypothetical protein
LDAIDDAAETALFVIAASHRQQTTRIHGCSVFPEYRCDLG